MFHHARAILWAQWRTLVHFYSRGNTSMLVFTLVISAIWYGMLAFGGISAGILAADPRQLPLLRQYAPTALLFLFLYWQIIPIVLASTGASLDLKRVLVYPVTNAELFGLEILLRLTTGVEVLIILTGVACGLIMNPALPWWSTLVFLPFAAMNLSLATGLRDLLGRLLARRRAREIAMLVLVGVAALPQLVLSNGVPEPLRRLGRQLSMDYWPWDTVSQWALGHASLGGALVMAGWTAAALAFGWWQFQRSLRFDADEARATVDKSGPAADDGGGWREALYRLPGRLLPDPTAAIVEKELRFLSRAPRFRLVFMMGFSFGLLIWLPLAMRSGRGDNFLSANYLTFVSVYALMLLGEVSFWNAFGFDRAAVQNYYVLPVKFSRVLIAKNIASVVFVLLEISAVAAVCAILRMPVSAAKLAECYMVTLVMTLLLLGIGNVGSVYYPRPVNPVHSWRTASAGRFQALLMLLYPVVGIPVALAYLARYAFQSQAAFYGVLAFGAAFAAVFYWVALDSAVRAAESRKELVVTALSAGEGPVAA